MPTRKKTATEAMTSHYKCGLKLSCKKSTRIVTFHVKYDESVVNFLLII